MLKPKLHFCRLMCRADSLEKTLMLGKTEGKGEGWSRWWGFPGDSDGKESACNAGDLGLILGLGRSPGAGHGNPLQYSCLGESSWTEKPGGLQSIWFKESDMTEATKHSHMQQKMQWLDSITNLMDMSLRELQETLEERGTWRAIVHGVTRSQTRLSDWTTNISGVNPSLGIRIVSSWI